MDNDRHSVTDHVSHDASGISRLPLLLIAGGVGLAMLGRRPGYRFDNKVVLITGGSRGLGLVLARQLARSGALIGLLAVTRWLRAPATIPAPSLVQRSLLMSGRVKVEHASPGLCALRKHDVVTITPGRFCRRISTPRCGLQGRLDVTSGGC